MWRTLGTAFSYVSSGVESAPEKKDVAEGASLPNPCRCRTKTFPLSPPRHFNYRCAMSNVVAENLPDATGHFPG